MLHEQAAFPNEYYRDADLRLIQAIPADALHILCVNCGTGHFSEVLEHLQPAREITATSWETKQTTATTSCVDEMQSNDYERAIGAVESRTFDCVVVGTISHSNPLIVLQRLRRLLRPQGHLIASFPNMQYWSIFDDMLRGDFPALNNASNGNSPQQYLNISNITKLFLDAGYLPRIADRRSCAAPVEWNASAQPAATRLGLDQEIFAARVQTLRYFIDACLIDKLPSDDIAAPPITLGACTNDPTVLQNNLLASPCLRSGHHEILTVENASSAGEGLNAIIAQAKHELIVLAHQDVYLPSWWIARLWQQYEIAKKISGGKIGVMGVYGVQGSPQGIMRYGRVADRDYLLDEPPPLPALVCSLDELLLAIPKDTPLRFDTALGFHLYGTDICLSAAEANLCSLVIDTPCYHNSKQGVKLPQAFEQSKAVLKAKWPSRLPIATPCDIIS